MTTTPRILVTLAALSLAAPALAAAPHGKAKAGHGEPTEQADHGGAHAAPAHGADAGHGDALIPCSTTSSDRRWI